MNFPTDETFKPTRLISLSKMNHNYLHYIIPIIKTATHLPVIIQLLLTVPVF
jgi:hypothetical protein